MPDKEEKIREKYLKDLYEDYRYSIEKFDSYTIYLSGGALAISLTFVENIVPIKEAVCIYLYYGAIILFGLTMLIGLFAHHRSAIEIDNRIKQIQKGDYSEPEKDKISIMNIILVGIITFGTLLLLTFAIVNMNVLNNKSKHKQHASISYEQPENTIPIIEIE